MQNVIGVKGVFIFLEPSFIKKEDEKARRNSDVIFFFLQIHGESLLNGAPLGGSVLGCEQLVLSPVGERQEPCQAFSVALRREGPNDSPAPLKHSQQTHFPVREYFVLF